MKILNLAQVYNPLTIAAIEKGPIHEIQFDTKNAIIQSFFIRLKQKFVTTCTTFLRRLSQNFIPI